MNIIPLVDHVLVEPLEAETETASGILLPGDKDEKPSKGKVVALPKDKTYVVDGITVTIDLEIGDIVYFTKYTPDEIEAKDKNYLVIKHSSLLAKEAK